MPNYKDKTVLIYDHGLFINVAQKLSESFGKVYYFSPWDSSFPTSNDTLIGSGFEDFERTNELFDKLDEIDLFVFTDVYSGSLQLYLQSIGKRVWGGRDGDTMEILRSDFITKMQEIGLLTPWTEFITGMTALKEYLSTSSEKFVKVDSVFRGDVETFHHINYDISKPILDKLAYKLGPRQEEIKFVVQDPIDAVVETGYDGYCIDGQFPDQCLFGIEVKDKGYIGEVRDYDKIPAQIKEINDKLSPLFKEFGYRGFFSSEIRVTADGDAYLIDMTCRCPSPPTSTMLEVYSNLAEIMYEGANGTLIQPEFNAKFGAEIIGFNDFLREGFVQLFFDDKDTQWIKQPNSCMIDDKIYCIPAKYDDMNMVANIVAIGDDIDSVISELKERVSSIKGNGFNADPNVLDETVEELKKL
jgi:hypothetical protein